MRYGNRPPRVASARSALWLVVAFAAPLGACSPDDAGVVVELRTDYRPRLDFWIARTEVSASPLDRPGGDVRRTDAIAETGGDYVTGVAIADDDGFAPGSVYVRVTLLDAGDAILAERDVVATISGRTAVTVVISAACRGVTCPSDAAHPERTECSGGRCVEPGCTDEHPELCPPPSCTGSADCTAPVACATVECRGGECLQLGDDSLCPPGQVCELATGCVMSIIPDSGLPPPRDGGTSCPGGGFEDTVPLCMNGADDDCDGRPDCADGDCLGVVAENDAPRCSNGIDEDCDTQTDCADPECAPFRTEDSASRCRDGLDNDCDGRLDCGDTDCHGFACREGETNWRCCGGSCVNTFNDEMHCGACGGDCAGVGMCLDGPDGHGRCQCTDDADCPTRGVFRCELHSGSRRCNCQGDAACGADFVCVFPGGDQHSFCRFNRPE